MKMPNTHNNTIKHVHLHPVLMTVKSNYNNKHKVTVRQSTYPDYE